MNSRILVVLEGSARDEAAVDAARQALGYLPGEITLAHAREGRSRGALRGALDARAEEYLEGVARAVDRPGIEVATAVREGNRAQSLLQLARDQGASMIAIAGRQRRGGNVRLDGTARNLLQKSKQPLLFAGTPRETEPSIPFGANLRPIRNVLVVLDASDRSLTLVPRAIEIARRSGATATLLYVLSKGTDPRLRVRMGEDLQRAADRLRDPAHVQVGRRLNDVRKEFGAQGVPATADVECGEPLRMIRTVSHAMKIDLITIAAHRERGRARYVRPSLCERLVGESDVPVLALANTSST